MQVNDIVIFSPRQGETAEGIVTRIWDKPASDPYVTVRTTEDQGRTFVRCQSVVQPVRLRDWLRDRSYAADDPANYDYHPGTGA